MATTPTEGAGVSDEDEGMGSSFVGGDRILAEMKALKRRIDEADYDNEPLYVTMAELAELRRLFGSKPPHDPVRPPQFYGKPVIVDPEKAAEQRARWA